MDLVLNEKELLLMKDIEKEKNKTPDEKMSDKLAEKEYRKTNKKAIEKDLLIACKNNMRDSFDRVFERAFNENGTNETTLQIALLQFYKVENRNAYIAEFGKSTVEYDFLNEVYDKTLKTVYNKWKKHVEYCQFQDNIKQQEELQKQLEQEEKDTKFENGVKIFFNILKWIAIIIFAPIVLLFIFISMCAKDR